MTLNVYNRFSKWLQVKWDNSINQTWWQTSFNMPVKSIFTNPWVVSQSWTTVTWVGTNFSSSMIGMNIWTSSTYLWIITAVSSFDSLTVDRSATVSSSTYTIYIETEWMLNSVWSATSFDMTWFQPWWEILVCDTVFTINWPFAWWTCYISQVWKKPDGTTIFTNWPYTKYYPSLGSWEWSWNQIVSNQWFADWEVNVNGLYTMTATITWAISQTDIFPFTITNCPSITIYTPWMMWIEWNNLMFVSANWHIHTVYWNSLGYVDTAKSGMFWIDTADNLVRWIWANGYKYAGKYNFKQFWSSFSNWPSPTVVSWQTPWYLWADSNFWYEHIWYIANDWYKWIFPSGWNPYCNPVASEWP